MSPERTEPSSTQGTRQEAAGREQRPGRSPWSRRFPWIFGFIVAIVGGAALAYHLVYGQYHVETKDAYVQGDLVRVAPKVSGTVTGITADETQYVRQGATLVRLDPTDSDVTLARAEASLAETVRDVAHLYDMERQAQAAVARQETQERLAARTLHRDRSIVGAGAISRLRIDQDQTAYRNLRQALREARARLASARSAVSGTDPTTHPQVLLAEANLRAAWLARQRAAVLAPVSGYIVRRTVQLGEQVGPGKEMLAIAPLGSVWVNANFKETQLSKLRIGQPVSLTADLYGGRYRFHGRVLGLAGGTGAALAVLPPENASGNWIKIVQRLPVRIGLDPGELRDHPLFLGLSMDVDVDVHDTRGTSLTKTPAWPAALRTDVYASRDAGVQAVIHRIVNENLGRSSPAVPRTARATP